MNFSTRHTFLIFILSTFIFISSASAVLHEIGRFNVGAEKPDLVVYYQPADGYFYKVYSNHRMVTPSDVQKLESLGSITGLADQDLGVFEFAGVFGGDSTKDAFLVKHGKWVSVVDIKSDKLLFSNIGPIAHLSSDFLVRFFFDKQGARFFRTYFFIADIQSNENDDDDLNLKTNSSLIPAESLGSRKKQKALFIIGGTRKEVRWVPLRADVADYAFVLSKADGDTASTWTLNVDLTEGQVATAKIDLQKRSVLNADPKNPAILSNELKLLSDVPASEELKQESLRSRMVIGKALTEEKVEKKPDAEKTTVEPTKDLAAEVDAGWDKIIDPYSTVDKYYEFLNKNRLVTKVENGLYTISFLQPGKLAQPLFSAKTMVRFPVSKSEWLAFHKQAYHGTDKAESAVFVSDSGVHVVHQNGNVALLPFDYDKIDDLNNVSFTAFLSEKMTYHVVSLKYAAKYQYSDVEDSTVVEGETFLIRDSDGKSLRVDYAFHEIKLKTSTEGKSSIENIYGSEGILTIGNSERPIDLHEFDAEARFEVLPSKLIEVEVQKEKGEKKYVKRSPLKVVRARFTDISAEQLNQRTAYPITDEKLRTKMHLASVNRGQGSFVLVGETGVGKTELLDGYVADVVEGKFKGIPRTRVFIRFDLLDADAGARYVGMFSERILAIREMAKRVPLTLVTDEIHTLRGGGTHSEQSNDVMNTFKTMLAKGLVRMVGTSTMEEYSNAFGGDTTLKRRLPTLTVEESPKEQVIAKAKNYLNKNQLPAPSEKVLSAFYEMSTREGAVGKQPSKINELMSTTYALMETQGREGQVPTEKDVQLGAQEIYNKDEAFFDEEKRRERLENLDRYLDENVIGMHDAKRAIVRLARNAYAGVSDPLRPAMRGLIVGGTGLGKSELAKSVAHGMKLNFHRVDMSGYANGDVVGFKEEVYMVLAKSASSVICFDEFEKAHLVVRQALLRMFDDGKFTVEMRLSGSSRAKSVFREVDATKAWFLVTGNMGAAFIRDALLKGSGKKKVGFSPAAVSLETAMHKPQIDPLELNEELIASGMTPEILGRFQEVLYAVYPKAQDFQNIVALHVKRAVKEIEASSDLKLTLENLDAFLLGVVHKYYREDVSGRSVQVLTANLLRSPIGEALIKGTIKRGQSVKVTFDEEGVKSVEQLPCLGALL